MVPPIPQKVDSEFLTHRKYTVVKSALRNPATSSKSMRVDGSVTPVEFIYNVSGGINNSEYLSEIKLVFLAKGVASVGVFGASSIPLSNGVDVILKIAGIDYVLCNMKDNGDIALFFSDETLSITKGGFLEEEDNYQGKIVFKNPLLLESGDQIRFVINDNLLIGLTGMQASVNLYKLI